MEGGVGGEEEGGASCPSSPLTLWLLTRSVLRQFLAVDPSSPADFAQHLASLNAKYPLGEFVRLAVEYFRAVGDAIGKPNLALVRLRH